MIKRVYYYFFYKIYKSIEYTSEEFGGQFFTSFKAGLVMIVFEMWLLVSLLIYYKLYINLNANIIGSNTQWIILVIILVLIDYFIFHSRNQWKNIIIEFDQLPRKKNAIGSWIVLGVIVLIITNFIYSFWLYYNS